MASHKLRHYFEAHKIRVPTYKGLSDLFNNLEASARIAKRIAELSGYNIAFEQEHQSSHRSSTTL
jgi:hypothetical protein